ncbi:TetR family transcriptional regulator [Porphyrobacter sp. CACIAM 03H1]|jgi:AcrR family transcriptional regulator|nr:TetR family transcriptional regulator [Porphyrobacter sp. CACIAM 03H1]
MSSQGETSPCSDLREACVREALAIITSAGVEKLSLREVARRLGVSHQSPYRHFESRDHVLAEIVRRAFVDFAAALRGAPITDNPGADALQMGFTYVRFALTQPLQYRLMFGGSLPDPMVHSEMMRGARDAFNVLRDALRRVAAARGRMADPKVLDQEALFAWSSLHGAVSLLASDAMGTLDLDPGEQDAFIGHALKRIGTALGITPPHTHESS